MTENCATCGALVEVPPGEAAGRCGACGAFVFPRRGAAILVVHDTDRWAEEIGIAVGRIGLTAIHARNATRLEAQLENHSPQALVMDVAVTPAAIEVIDRWRTDPAGGGRPIVLVASVFNKTAYKRRPASLYGADDYVEQHHVLDKLPQKLSTLLGLGVAAGDEPGPSARGSTTLRRAAETALRDKGQSDVRALASAIVADIALYHEHEVVRAAGGEVEKALEAALHEGERLLTELAPKADGRPIEDAFQELLARIQRRDR